MKRRTFLSVLGSGFLLSQSVSAASPAKRDETVVIIGAGMAGLAAASALKERISKVIVLESRSRIAGRMKTDRSFGCAVDLGASWIHGIDGNPLVDLARASGAQLARTQFESMLPFDQDGGKFDRGVLIRSHFRLESLLASAPTRIRKSQSDEALQTIIDRHIDSSKWSASEKRAFDLVSALTEISDGAKLEDVSARCANEYKENSGGDHLVVSGYDTMARHLASGLEIKTHVAVRTVDSTGSTIKIETNVGTLHADRVVVTIPLGRFAARDDEVRPRVANGQTSGDQPAGNGGDQQDRPQVSEALLAARCASHELPWHAARDLSALRQSPALHRSTCSRLSRAAQFRECPGEFDQSRRESGRDGSITQNLWEPGP